MKKRFSFSLILCILSLYISSCNAMPRQIPDTAADNGESRYTETVAEGAESGITDIPDGIENAESNLTVTCSEGTQNCWSYDGDTLLFSGLDADTVCSLSGEWNGAVLIDAGDDYRLELELNGVTLYSAAQNPVTVLSGDKVILTAKKDTENFIYDTREAVSAEDTTVYSAAVYAKCDLELKGQGTLTVISAHNNGIHTKDDCTVRNLTLSVTCEDNALKGNDSVTVESGTVTLIAKTGDGIKTENTDTSSKGNQYGTVGITGGILNIYAACDGIDAAYNAEISGEAVLNIYTDSYSPYSEDAEAVENGDQLAAVYGYTEDNLSSLSYSSEAYAPQSSALSVSYLWGGNRGGGGGGHMRDDHGGGGFMQDGNSEKSDASAKGVKAGNEILISGGTVTVSAYDDAIHANSETALENGETPTGNVTVSGGTVTVFSKDDGIHADGALVISGGTVTVTGSYEGLEGTDVTVTGGIVDICSEDDGINATTTQGVGICFEGGTVSVYAGGDGMDSNSRTSYQGIVFAGGTVTVISTTSMNSSIDSEQGYSYTGGTVLALCPANGMAEEAVRCKSFTSVGCQKTMNLSEGTVLSVTENGNETVSVTMPCRLSALVVYLGSPDAEFRTTE